MWSLVRARLRASWVVRAAMTVVYSAAVLVGGSVFADLPDQVERTIGHPLTIIMAVLLIGGGGVGVWAVPHGCWRVERGAITLLGTAVALYITSLIVAYPSIDCGERSMRAWLLVMLAGTLVARLAAIWGPDEDPARRVGRGRRW